MPRSVSRRQRLALAIADVRYDGGASGPTRPAPTALHGWLGNRALVNGQLDAAGRSLRAGYGCRSSTPAMRAACCSGFRDGEALVPFHLLGTDGGLLAAPRRLERVFLQRRAGRHRDRCERAPRTPGGQPGVRSAPSHAGRARPPPSSCARALCAARGRRLRAPGAPGGSARPTAPSCRSSRCGRGQAQNARRRCRRASRRLRKSPPPRTRRRGACGSTSTKAAGS